MNEHQSVLCEKRDAVAVLTLHRPEKRNAVDPAMAAAMRQSIQDLARDDHIRAVVLYGGKDVFCAGMDLQAFVHGTGSEIFDGPGGFGGFVSAELPKPVIAAVEGFALAGGFELVLACDMVVAARGAVFGAPEVAVGLFAAAGGAFRLPASIPPKRAVEYLLTGARFTAAEAVDMGLVNRLAEDGEALEAALELADQVVANAPLGVAASLQLARMAVREREHELWKLSDELWQRVQRSEDAREGPAAFLEKRSPRWQGR